MCVHLTLGYSAFRENFFPNLMRGKTERNWKDALGAAGALVEVARDAIEAVRNGQFARLDALTTANNCEIHTLAVWVKMGASPALHRECDALAPLLERGVDSFHDLSGRFKTDFRGKKQAAFMMDVKKFLATYLDQEISESMGAVVQSRLLTITKESFRNRYTGYVEERTNSEQWEGAFSRGIKETVIADVQRSLTHFSYNVAREQLSYVDDPLLSRMFNCEQMVEVRSMPYTSQYSRSRLLLRRAEALGGMLVFAKETKKGEDPVHLFYECTPSGVRELGREVIESMDPRRFTLVCQVVTEDMELVRRQIAEYQLRTTFLACNAVLPQFPHSDEVTVQPDEEIERAIRQDQERADQMGVRVLGKNGWGRDVKVKFIHIAPSSLGEELTRHAVEAALGEGEKRNEEW